MDLKGRVYTPAHIFEQGVLSAQDRLNQMGGLVNPHARTRLQTEISVYGRLDRVARSNGQGLTDAEIQSILEKEKQKSDNPDVLARLECVSRRFSGLPEGVIGRALEGEWSTGLSTTPMQNPRRDVRV